MRFGGQYNLTEACFHADWSLLIIVNFKVLIQPNLVKKSDLKLQQY
jgi:hypothetical protein